MSVRNHGLVARMARRVAAWLSARWIEDASPPLPVELASPIGADPVAMVAAAGVSPVEEALDRVLLASNQESALVAVAAALVEKRDEAGNLAIAGTRGDTADISAPGGQTVSDRRLSGRIAAVSKLNSPLARAPARNRRTPPAGRAVPMPPMLEIKKVKERRLPTAVAFKPSRAKVHSAEIIRLADVRHVAKGKRSHGAADRRAA